MKKLDRRNFLKLGASLVGAGALGVPGAASAMGRGPERPPLAIDRVVNGNCQFCQVRCRLKLSLSGGRIVLAEGDPEDVWTAGAMCPKGKSQLELVESPHRLLYPMVRDGSSWKRITYAQALDLVVSRIEECKAKHQKDYSGRVVLFSPLWDCREGEIAADMALSAAGFSNILTPGETCISSASNILSTFLGTPNSTTTVNELENTGLVLLWGANIAETLPPYARWIEAARAKGAKVLYLDCRTTHTSALCDRQIMLRPGTDGVLAMGVLNLLIQTGAYDADYVAAHVRGFDNLAKAVTPYTPEEVARITRLPAETVTELASAIGASKRTILWLGGSLSRYSNGMQTIRALVAMQGITNRMFGPGSGIITMEGGKPGDDEVFLEHYRAEGLPEGQNMRRVTRSMAKGEVDVLFLNSSYRRYPDCNAVKAAIEKVGFVVFRGHFMNEEAALAQLIIPTPFGLESDGSMFGAERQVFWREATLAPAGEVVADWKFYRDLGQRLAPQVYPKFESAGELYEMFRKAVPSWRGLSLARLQKAPSGVVWPSFAEDEPERIGNYFAAGKLMTADGDLELDSSVLGPLTWQEPKGSPLADKAAKDFPLIFTQGKVAWHWQQSLTNYSQLIAQFCSGRQVFVHPSTAGGYGIESGDAVKIRTELGELSATAVVTEGILPGVVFTASHFSPSAPFEGNRGQSINTVVPNNWDRVSAQFNGFGCQLVKA